MKKKQVHNIPVSTSTAPGKVTESVTLGFEMGEWLREYAHRTRDKKQHILRRALAEYRERMEKAESTITPPSRKPPLKRP